MAWLLADSGDADILEEIERGSDRSAGIVAAAYFEDQLSETIRTALEQEKESADRMLKGYGPLAAFSAKIEMGFLLGMYRDYMRQQFHDIREIRNRFAHRSGKRTFDTPEIRDRCNKLPPPIWLKRDFYLTPEELKYLIDADDERVDWRNTVISDAIFKGPDTPRNRYLIAIKSALVHLYLIRLLAEQRRQATAMNANLSYWPWPSLDKSERRESQDHQNDDRKTKKRVRPQRPSQKSK